MKPVIAILATALLLFTAAAHAQVYVTAGAAYIDTPHQSDSFFTPGIGYRFGRVSVEASYLSANLDSSGPTTVIPPNQNSTTARTNELSGAKLSLLAAFPLGERVDLLGTVSAYSLKSKAREVDTLTTFGPNGPIASTVTGDRSSSTSGSAFSLGAGLSFAVMKSLDLRWLVEFSGGKDALNLDNFMLITLAAAYRF